jgi:hypothetical protein
MVCAFILYVLLKWVTGPYFKQVHTGPTPVPGWMKASMISWQIVMPAAWLCLLYATVIRPWRRERTFTSTGLFFLAGTTLVFQDAFSSYFNNWITYNAYLVNRGSWVNDIPGWMAYGQPGHMLVEPVLFIPWVHGCVWLVFAALGSWLIKRCQARWPGLGYPAILTILFVSMCLLDFVLEGLIWMPFGLLTYAGGHTPALFPSTYHKMPFNESLFMGTWSTALACLYHFRNDKNQMWVERGLETIRGGTIKKAALRFLALVAALHIGVLIFYTVPQTALFSSKAASWPRDVQNRSYLTDGLCGAGTVWACPGPNIPLNRGPQSISIGPDGKLVLPQGVKLPKTVPFVLTPRSPCGRLGCRTSTG